MKEANEEERDGASDGGARGERWLPGREVAREGGGGAHGPLHDGFAFCLRSPTSCSW